MRIFNCGGNRRRHRAILIVAVFYRRAWLCICSTLPILVALGALNRAAIYRVTPYVLLGLLLWFCIHQGGIHATLAGVLLALFIPTRPPPDYQTLMAQADAIVANETARGSEEMRHALSSGAMRAVDAIFDRLESPASRLLRHVEIRSSYVVLPIFAFANAGVTFAPGLLDGRGDLVLAIAAGLLVGKPVGLLVASYAAVKIGVAKKPDAYGWAQVAGAGCLAGIGFTMSLFIASQSFPQAADFDAAKVAIYGASALSAILGIAILWRASVAHSPTR